MAEQAYARSMSSPDALSLVGASPFTRVLVPLDGSRLARTALLHLRRFLGGGEAHVTLLRVIGRDPGDGPARAARADLEQARGEVGAGPSATIDLRTGDDAAEEILRAAPAHDLVAMATHGRTGLDRWVRGSVAERVLRGCPVPLLLCNPHTLVATPAAGVARIVAALDGSERAAEVLPALAGIARAHGALVTLLVVEGAAPAEASAEEPRAEREARLRAALEALQRAGVRAHLESREGPVASEILRAAQQADLLALTSHGRTGAARWWFGSTAEEVLRRATCPLLLLVRSAPRAASAGPPSP